MAPAIAIGYAWSKLGAPIASALTAPQPPLQKGHTRKLSLAESESIVGAQIGAHSLTYSPASGEAFPWEGSSGGTNTGNGNKQTSVPIVGWTARGGLPVAFTIYHNSQGNHNDELGQKWTHRYEIYAVVNGGSGDVTLHWGGDLGYTFTKNINGTYTAPTGIHDKLVTNGSPITSYDVTTKDNVKYHITNPNGTGWYISTISDLNGNTINVNHNSGNYVTTIVDPTGRTITLSYTSNKITGISDPLSRSWSISYTSGDLTQITYPAVGGNSYNEQFAYNGNHDIATFTDKRGHTGWTAVYDPFDDSLSQITDANSNTTIYQYASGQTTISDPNVHSIKHVYTSNRLSSVVDQTNTSGSYTYDSDNNKTQVTDLKSQNWSYTYDSAGNVLTKTDPLSHVWTYTYNSKNEVLTVTDPLFHVVTNVYDGSGNLSSTTDGMPHSTN